MRTPRCDRGARLPSRTPRSPSLRSPATAVVSARPHSSGARRVARDSAHARPPRDPHPGRGRRRRRGRHAHVLAGAAGTGGSHGAPARADRHARAARRPAARPRARPASRGAVRHLARPVRPRGLGPEHRHRPPGARPARGSSARDGGAGRHLAHPQLSARPRGRRLAVRRRPTRRRGALRHHRHPVRAAGVLARAHARDGVHVLGTLAPGVRCDRARRQRAHRLEPPRRPATALRAAARHTHADWHRGSRAVRARRDARCQEPGLREDRGGQGAVTVPRYTAPRCKKCFDPGDHADRPVVAGAVLRCGAGGGRVRMARRGPAPSRGGPGPRLPGRHGGHRGHRRVGCRGQPADRPGRRVDRPAHPARQRRDVRSLWRDRRAAFGVAVLALVTGAAVAGPLVSGGSPTAQHDVVATRFLRPLATDHAGSFHALGTDRFGRDVWTRLVYGARVSLAVGALAVLLSVVIGVLVGAAAGFWPGPVRTALLALTDFVLAVPRVVLLLLLAAMARPSAGLVIVVLGLTGWMSVARLVHGEVRSLAARPFVEGAVALGLPRGRVLVRHILPNALTPVIVSAALGLGNAITLETSLSFLGLGVQPPTPSWGNMIASGRDTLVNAPWVATAPGIALVLVVVACTLLGDALQDALNPTARHDTVR